MNLNIFKKRAPEQTPVTGDVTPMIPDLAPSDIPNPDDQRYSGPLGSQMDDPEVQQQYGFELAPFDPVAENEKKWADASREAQSRADRIRAMTIGPALQTLEETKTASDALVPRIDATLQKLQAPPPAAQVPQATMGDNIGTLLAGLITHNPNAYTAGIASSDKMAQQREAVRYTNAMNQYKNNREVDQFNLEQLLKDQGASEAQIKHISDFIMQQQAKNAEGEIDQGYALQKIKAQGDNQIAVQNARSQSKSSDAAWKAINDYKSTAESRLVNMNNLEQEFIRTGGASGRMFTPEEKAAILSHTGFENRLDADTARKVAQGQLDIAKIGTEGAKKIHYGVLDKDAESRIVSRGISDNLKKEQTELIKEKVAYFPKEKQLQAADTYSRIAKRATTGGGTSGAQVRDLATMEKMYDGQSRSILQQMKQIQAGGTDFIDHSKWTDPAAKAKFDELQGTLEGIRGEQTKVTASASEILKSNNIPPKPQGMTDEQIKAWATKSMKAPGANKANIQKKLDYWGIQ